MNHDPDVVVVGAGPAGSYAASLLSMAGHRVALLEQGSTDDLAPRCTGVVGLPYVKMVGLDPDVVLAEARSATFISPSGARVRVSSPDVQACVLDRALLERLLRRRAVASGTELLEDFVVSRVARLADSIEVAGRRHGKPERFSCRALVLAAGVSPGLSRQAGLDSPGRYLVGAHMELEMDGVTETEVHLVPDLVPGAFAWLVPVAPRRVRVGVLCGRSAAAVARRFLERSGIKDRLISAPETIAQRPIPVATPGRTYTDRIVAVGDAAGQVKPTTGGGLYFGAMAARAAADVVGRALEQGDLSSRALRAYERRWRNELGSELRRGAFARRVYEHLSPTQVDRILVRAQRTGLAYTLLESRSFSFDRHGATLLAGLLRCLPAVFLGGGTPEPEVCR